MQGFVIMLAHPAGFHCARLFATEAEALAFIDSDALLDLRIPFIPEHTREKANVCLIEFDQSGNCIRTHVAKRIELNGAPF